MSTRIGRVLAVTVVALSLAGCGDDKSGGKKSGGGSSGGGKKNQEEITAGGWGDLKIKFVYGGTRPTPTPVSMVGNADAPFCKKHNPVDESLVVGSGKELANVVVYLNPARGTTPRIHDDYKTLEGQPVELANRGCRFVPHVAMVWTKRTLVFTNEDTMNHNTNASFVGFNSVIPAGGRSPPKACSKSESMPMGVECNLHDWMKAHVLVRDNPYMGVSDADGLLVIKNVPTGNWEFIVWHERAGYVKQAKRNGKAEVWTRGRVKFAIKPDENELVTVEIAAELLKKK